MRWSSAIAALAASAVVLPSWPWLVVSIVPDILLVASLIGLWRHLVSSRREADREVAAARTELRSAEAASAAQTVALDVAQRLQVVAENAADIVMETDDAGIIRWITPTVVQRTGRRPEELVGTAYFQHVHPDDAHTVRSLERQAQQGMANDAELRLRSADGSYHWFALSLRPVFDDRHTVVRRVGGWRDIHAEVLAREAAATERQRLRAQMTSMIHPLVLGQPVRDAEGRVTDFIYADVNPAACAFIGRDREQIVGRRLLEFFPQVDSTGLLARFATTAETGRPTVIDDFPFPMAGGEVHWMDIRAVRADGWVSFVWRDDTERRRALDAIAASEERFRLLAENTTDVVLHVDANDRMVWLSPSVASVLGWSVADGMGRDMADLLATDEALRQYRRDKARVFAGEGAVSRAQVRSKDGAFHWMEVHASPYRQADGRIDGLIASMRIIDAEILAEQALERRAVTDDLTGLLNRKEMMDRLDRLVSRGAGDVAVLWCDIDHFKEINDVHGHAAGDAVLEALGTRIRGCLPTPEALGGRIGGDELMVAVHGLHSMDEAVQLAERLRGSAAEPIPFPGGVVAATVSIGVTLGLSGEGIDSLLARADDAMYRAKAQGRNRVVAIPASAGVGMAYQPASSNA